MFLSIFPVPYQKMRHALEFNSYNIYEIMVVLNTVTKVNTLFSNIKKVSFSLLGYYVTEINSYNFKLVDGYK